MPRTAFGQAILRNLRNNCYIKLAANSKSSNLIDLDCIIYKLSNWYNMCILVCVTNHHCRRSHWWHASNLSKSLGVHPNPDSFSPTSFFLSAIFFNALVTPPGTVAPIWNVLLRHLCFSPNLLPVAAQLCGNICSKHEWLHPPLALSKMRCVTKSRALEGA